MVISVTDDSFEARRNPLPCNPPRTGSRRSELADNVEDVIGRAVGCEGVRQTSKFVCNRCHALSNYPS